MNKLRVPFVKICGLSTPESVHAACSGEATLIGFIFFSKSPRNVSPSLAAELAGNKGEAQSVAVTVNAEDTFLDDIVETLNPDWLQLHGSESVERVVELKERFDRPVIKAFSIRNSTDLHNALAYDGVADMMLMDAKPPENSQLPGGNGVSFDWSLVSDFRAQAPVLLSGGIDLNNVGAAIETISRRENNLQGIDVSSGVESSPGVKDIQKITSFLSQCRND